MDINEAHVSLLWKTLPLFEVSFLQLFEYSTQKVFHVKFFFCVDLVVDLTMRVKHEMSMGE